MLSQEDNHVLTRSGPGTSMGALLRRFWMPVLLSEEVPAADREPKRVTLLGEPLLVFRDTTGRLGLVDRRCPHRGADLYYGRNEDCGLRCVYHGWKFDVDGNCLELPTAPDGSRFKDKISLTAYPTREVGGIVWAYMGPRNDEMSDDLPDIPKHEFTLLPAAHVYVSKKWQECNWVQSLEGGIDTAHLSFLHMPAPSYDAASAAASGEVSRAALSDQDGDGRVRWVRDDPCPSFTVLPHAAGLLLGAARRADGDDIYWRTTQFLMPNNAYAPNAFAGETQHGQTWVPIDDQSCWIYTYSWNSDRPLTEDERAKFASGFSIHSEVDENYLPIRRMENDYLIDREDQRRNSYTGILGVSEQDAAIQNSQGAIVDRSREHLGETDIGIIEFRKLMLGSARALDGGEAPAAASAASGFAVQCGGAVAHRDVSLEEVMRQRFGHETGYVGARYGL
jgi:phthalate 4,5-dioxygenase